MYTIVYTKKAAADIPKLKAVKLDKKAKALIEVIRENPCKIPPPYEKLVGNLQGAYSRRINIKHSFFDRQEKLPDACIFINWKRMYKWQRAGGAT